MRSLLAIGLAFAFVAIGAEAANLNISVESGQRSAITVPPGFVVAYRVVGELSDDQNEGLALVGLDLSFDGGDLSPADEPTTPPMVHFKTTRGITNPAGFGGTVIDGRLVQVGGMQNTMGAAAPYLPFPVGPVVTDVAHPDQAVVLASGFVTAPVVEGVYILEADEIFVNVIGEGEDGSGFWATEMAGIGSVTSLTISVSQQAAAIGASVPVGDAIDARQPWAPDGTDVDGWDTIELTILGDTSSISPDDFVVTHTAEGPPPTVESVTPAGEDFTVVLSDIVELIAWTTITHDASGTAVRIGYLPGDVDGSGQTNANDILALIDHLNEVEVRPLYQVDIDRDGETDADDLFRLMDLLSGEGAYEPGFVGQELPE